MADERPERGSRAAATRPVRRTSTARAGAAPAAAMRTASATKGGHSTVALVERAGRPRPVARTKAAPRGEGAGKATVVRPALHAARGGKSATVKGGAKAALKRGAKPAKSVRPIRMVKIKELNAQGKCGPGTSVVHLFRVDEVCDGAAAVHLVFFDRHGWYCEHGRSCPAVDDVRKLAGSQLARTY